MITVIFSLLLTSQPLYNSSNCNIYDVPFFEVYNGSRFLYPNTIIIIVIHLVGDNK